MSDLDERNDLARRYVELWNEPDAHLRQAAIVELFAPDAAHYTPAQEVHGHAEMQTRVTASYQKWVEPGAHVFRAVANANGHHDAVRFNWEMVNLESGAVVSVGFDFVTLDEHGRIATDHQFIDR